MGTDPLIWQLVLQVVLIALNAVFACAEIAILSINEQKLEKMAEEGNKKAAKLARLTSQPARFLATIQVSITLAGFLGSAFAADNFAERLVNWLVGIGCPVPLSLLNTVSVVLITLILSYFTLVFGELVPKRVAMRKSEQIALGISGLVSGISVVFKPIVSLLTVSTNAVLRLMHIDPDAQDETVTEEEIRMMVDAGEENGAIDAEEKEIIQNVFAFDDLTAGEIATHRTDVSILWTEESMEEWEKIIHDKRHTMYPVCGETADDVLGLLNAKDYFRLADKSRENVLKLIRPAYFVPEGVKADVLFRNMRKNRSRIAIVLDEFGGMQGVITLNDLLEQLVGDLEDGDEPVQAAEIEKLGENTWRISGSAELDEVAEQLEIELPVDDYDTFGGFAFSSLGMVPDDGTVHELDVDELHIRIEKVLDHKVVTALVTKTAKPKADEAEE
ncbi:MAG: HlyC/CorC family transporter [Clostridia bacterium]|nr:HlyC/CorC family transporter [Clostridia bacterium]